MRLRAALALTALLLLLPPAAARAGTVGHVRYAIDSQAAFPSYEQTAQRHGVVILHAWQQDRMRALKRANPGLKVLVYKNLTFAAEDASPEGFASTGVKAPEAERDHPGWFLRNTDGQRFTSWSYRWLWTMDVGDPSYQARWADNVVAELQSQGWDGVFMDDTNTTMRHHYDVDRIARYPSDAAWAAATRSALSHIAPRVRAAGKLAFANIGSWAEHPAHGRDWLGLLDGAMDEMFLKWGKERGEGYMPERWRAQLDEVREAERQGKTFIGITHSQPDDARAARLGYATVLLGSEGRAQFALAADYTHETWFPEYDYDLGAPLGPAEAGPAGVHRRAFERGLVVVNPTGASRTVDFGGVYSGSGLGAAGGTTMPPMSGLVLRREGSGPAGGGPRQAPIVVLATARGPHQVELRWTRRPGVKRFRVLRNGRPVRTVRGRGMRDRALRPGRRYRYRVIALAKGGRKLGRSRRLRIRTPRLRPPHPSASAAGRRALHVALSPRAPGWSKAFLERRSGGRWRQVTRPRRPRGSMWFRLPGARRARVRVVVESTDGRTLRSAALSARRGR
jgi:Hypothetical glycosyl hydrolase family 15